MLWRSSGNKKKYPLESSDEEDESASQETVGLCDCCKARTVLKCSGCNAIYFCSRKCQKEFWPKHKQFCKPNRMCSKKDHQKITKDTFKILATGQLANKQKEATDECVRRFMHVINRTYRVVDEDNLPIELTLANLVQRKRLKIIYPEGTGIKPANLNFLTSPSLAAELYAIYQGNLNARPSARYQFLEGGVMDMIDKCDIFWSMVIYYHNMGTTLPPVGKRGDTWQESYLGREYYRWLDQMQIMSSQSRASASEPKQTLHVNTESLALVNVLIGQGEATSAHPLHPCTHLITNYRAEVPLSEAALPEWWATVRDFWDAELAIATETKLPNCIFYLTPYGCQIGEKACGMRHCKDFRRKFYDIQKATQNLATYDNGKLAGPEAAAPAPSTEATSR